MFVARMRHGMFRSGQGKEESPLYLKADGTTTHMKDQARKFLSDEEMDMFLKNLPIPNQEGRVPEVEKEYIS